LDIIINTLKSGVSLTIQGSINESKPLTTQVAIISLFSQSHLNYTLSEQTKVSKLLRQKLLYSYGTDLVFICF
jgi:hypothetical protein